MIENLKKFLQDGACLIFSNVLSFYQSNIAVGAGDEELLLKKVMLLVEKFFKTCLVYFPIPEIDITETCYAFWLGDEAKEKANQSKSEISDTNLFAFYLLFSLYDFLLKPNEGGLLNLSVNRSASRSHPQARGENLLYLKFINMCFQATAFYYAKNLPPQAKVNIYLSSPVESQHPQEKRIRLSKCFLSAELALLIKKACEVTCWVKKPNGSWKTFNPENLKFYDPGFDSKITYRYAGNGFFKVYKNERKPDGQEESKSSLPIYRLDILDTS